jgi:phosphatidylethanolamine-binding protein (PEBP) family uncharacterized protein
MLKRATAAWLAVAVSSTAALAGDLTVDFKFDSSSRCSRTSPEIRVGGVPEGTVAFRVRLKDKNVPSWRHGGGKVVNDGSGIIPKGALTDGYNGPCPPSGSHYYVFTVQALDTKDEELAEGEATERFP